MSDNVARVGTGPGGVKGAVDAMGPAMDNDGVGQLPDTSKQALARIWGNKDVSQAEVSRRAPTNEGLPEADEEDLMAPPEDEGSGGVLEQPSGDSGDKELDAPPSPIKDDLGLPEELLSGKKKDAEEEPAADEEPPAKLSPKDREAFIHKTKQIKELREKTKTFEAKVKEYETKMRELEEQMKVAKAVPVAHEAAKTQELENKLKEAEEKLGRYDLAATESFQRQYDVPLQALAKKAAKLLTTAERPADKASELANRVLSASSRDELVELLVDEPLPVQGALFSLVNDVAEISENREVALTNWRASRAAVEEEATRNGKAKLVQNIVQTTEEAMRDLQAEGNLLLTPLADNPEWNAAVEKRIDVARGILHQGDPKLLTKLVMDGVTAPTQRELYKKLYNAYLKLKSEADALVGGSPRVGGEGRPVTPKQPVKAPISGKDVLDSTWGKEE